MAWTITIFTFFVIVLLVVFHSLKSTMELRIKCTENYEKLNDIIIYKAKQCYDIFRIRDLAVYINNDTRLSQEDFILYSTSFRDFFKIMCGDLIYSLACKAYGSEKGLKLYLTLIFHNYIIDDKLIKASEVLYSNLMKEGE